MRAKFTIEPREKYFAFSFQSEDGQMILFSRLFRTEKLCREGITELIRVLAGNDAFEKLQGLNGEFSFVVRNAKKVTLGHSAVFYAASSRDFALRKLQWQAAKASVVNAGSVGTIATK